jgi:hypothetical protein
MPGGHVWRPPGDDAILQGGQDLGEDRLLQRIGRDALLVAALRAVPLAGKAGVVAVGAAVAVRGGADKPIAAAPAAQEPGQQVVGGVGGPVTPGPLALGHDPLRPREHLVLHQRGVLGLVRLAVERQPPDIGRIPQDLQHPARRPPAAPAGRVAGVVEQPADHRRPQPRST